MRAFQYQIEVLYCSKESRRIDARRNRQLPRVATLVSVTHSNFSPQPWLSFPTTTFLLHYQFHPILQLCPKAHNTPARSPHPCVRHCRVRVQECLCGCCCSSAQMMRKRYGFINGCMPRLATPPSPPFHPASYNTTQLVQPTTNNQPHDFQKEKGRRQQEGYYDIMRFELEFNNTQWLQTATIQRCT